MNFPVYNGTIFSSVFTDQNLMPNLNKKISCGHVTKIPPDDGLLSELTTGVNEDDPECKRVIKILNLREAF